MIQGKPGQVGDDLERQLFIVRKLIERQKTAAMGPAGDDFYVCTLSNRTIVYKGMLRSVVVGQFFKDLVNTDYETAFAIYHRWGRLGCQLAVGWQSGAWLSFFQHHTITLHLMSSYCSDVEGPEDFEDMHLAELLVPVRICAALKVLWCCVEQCVVRICVICRRFSTNTTPKWPLAQPMRVLGHNGEQHDMG
jgi:hypothetical protein